MSARRPIAIGAVAVLVVSGTAATVPVARAATAVLTYTCQFATGAHQVGTQVAVTVPGRATAGEPIQPDAVSVTVALPAAALTALTDAGAASVGGTANLAVAVTQNGTAVGADWSGLALPAGPIPAEGELIATAAGPVPSVTVIEPGEIVVTARDLDLELVTTTAEGGPTDPATWPVPCVLDPDQEATLATIAVPAAGGPSSSAARPPSSANRPPGTPNRPPGRISIGPSAVDTPGAPGLPGSPGAQPSALADEIPPECGDIPPLLPGQTNCAYVTGYANVKKLNGSILVEPALSNIALGRARLIPPRPPPPPVIHQDSIGELAVPDGQFPPLTATFLSFGFVPITATMELTTIELPATEFVPPAHINLHAEGESTGQRRYTITVTAKLAARVYAVRVNGVPLDVGPNCRTERPIDSVLRGGTPEYTDIRLGGPLTGFVEIPPFVGCGATENLDPLITGTVSGPGNFVRLLQGSLCNPRTPTTSKCPPTVPSNPPPTGSQ